MNFFEHQAAAQKQTKRLIWMFFAAVLAIVLAIDFTLLLMLTWGQREALGAPGMSLAATAAQHSGILGFATVATASVIGIAALFRMSSLREGGGVVAASMGASYVSPDSTNPAYRQLRNVVEEIAIASGVPVPDIFVMEHESGINAFAAGYSSADAAIAVTRGCLEKLTRDELQGVIAHEFSHVLNGDMRLNLRLMGVLFGILLLAQIGGKVLRHSRGGGRSKNGGAILFMAVALLVVGSVGQLFARLIKASVSRQREFLADASAVQFTRQSSGIGGALKKIAALSEGSALNNRDTEEVSHMLFGQGFATWAMFATHPPLAERITRIAGHFRSSELDRIRAQWQAPVHTTLINPGPGVAVSVAGFAPAGVLAAADSTRGPAALPSGPMRVTAKGVAQHVGEPAEDDHSLAASLMQSLPANLHAIAHDDATAPLLLLALLMSHEPHVRTMQSRSIERLVPGQGGAVAALSDDMGTLHPMQRLPLAGLCMPALRRRPADFLHQLQRCIHELKHADGELSLFEVCVGHMLRVHIEGVLDPAGQRATGRQRLHQLKPESIRLLSVLARHGHPDAASAQTAFAAGVQVMFFQTTAVYAPLVNWVAVLDQALPALDTLDGFGKELLIEAIVTTASHDGVVSLQEAELIRAISACLHCPLPVLLVAMPPS